MKVIENEYREINERVITKHLLEINQDNDTVTIAVDNLTVRVFVLDKEGYINLKAEYHVAEVPEFVGPYES